MIKLISRPRAHAGWSSYHLLYHQPHTLPCIQASTGTHAAIHTGQYCHTRCHAYRPVLPHTLPCIQASTGTHAAMHTGQYWHTRCHAYRPVLAHTLPCIQASTATHAAMHTGRYWHTHYTVAILVNGASP